MKKRVQFLSSDNVISYIMLHGMLFLSESSETIIEQEKIVQLLLKALLLCSMHHALHEYCMDLPTYLQVPVILYQTITLTSSMANTLNYYHATCVGWEVLYSGWYPMWKHVFCVKSMHKLYASSQGARMLRIKWNFFHYVSPMETKTQTSLLKVQFIKGFVLLSFHCVLQPPFHCYMGSKGLLY